MKRHKQWGGLKPNRWLSPEQYKKLLGYTRQRASRGVKRWATNEIIILILLCAGLRAEELLSLTVEDTPAVHGKDELWVSNGKGDISRTVDIGAGLSRWIKRYIKLYRRGAKPRSPLIAREGGGRRMKWKGCWVYSPRLSYRSLLDRVKRTGEAAGIEGLTPHKLRHTFAMNLYRVAKDLRNVQDQLGHSTSKTTEIYARTDNAERRHQIELMTGPLFADYG